MLKRNGKRLCCKGNESSSRVEVETNPLLNHVVITRLLDFCKLSDLFNYRLVSKAWYSASLPRIRNEARVEISNSYEDSRAGALHWSTFHEHFQVDAKQFKSFELVHFDFFDPPPPTTLPQFSLQRDLLKGRDIDIVQMYKNMEQFWEQFGQSIRTLKLESSSVYSPDAFKKAIFQDLPNLEKLVLQNVKLTDRKGCNTARHQQRQMEDKVVKVNSNLKDLTVIYSLSYGNFFPISFSLLYNHFPNIQKLDLGINEPSSEEVIIAPLVTKLESQDNILLKFLKLRQLSKEQSASLRRMLQLPKLKLASLDLGFGQGVAEDSRTLQVALRFQGDNLESLFVSTCSHRHNFGMLEPPSFFHFRTEPLESLTHLDLSGPLFSNLHFLQLTPNLKILRIRANLAVARDVKRLLEDEMMRDTKLPFLEEFYFESCRISEEEMKRVVSMMPNVERFHAEIDSSAFCVVCESWQKLTALAIDSFWGNPTLIHVDDVGDYAITGIVDGCDERRPNITDLQCLEKFEIKYTGKIGDASIWNGFLKLPKLSALRVTVSPETSDQAYRALRKRFPSRSVTRKRRTLKKGTNVPGVGTSERR